MTLLNAGVIDIRDEHREILLGGLVTERENRLLLGTNAQSTTDTAKHEQGKVYHIFAPMCTNDGDSEVLKKSAAEAENEVALVDYHLDTHKSIIDSEKPENEIISTETPPT